MADTKKNKKQKKKEKEKEVRNKWIENIFRIPSLYSHKSRNE